MMKIAKIPIHCIHHFVQTITYLLYFDKNQTPNTCITCLWIYRGAYSLNITASFVTLCFLYISLSSGGGLMILSSCSLGEVSSWEAGLYLPSDLLFLRAMMRKTRTPTMAIKSIPPTTGPTIKAMSPDCREDYFKSDGFSIGKEISTPLLKENFFSQSAWLTLIVQFRPSHSSVQIHW